VEAKVSTLSNGLRIVSESMEGLETVSLGIWVDVGARDENYNVNGVSHLLEHMAFKGTERRSAQAIAEEIEAVGGHLNAYTSREQTAYYAKVMRVDVGLAVDLLADILLNSIFDDQELARERSVVLQEIAQSQDTPDDQIFEYFQEVAYPNQPLGRSILGSAEKVAAYQRSILINYMNENYSPDRMVISAAGSVDHNSLVSMIDEKFGHLNSNKPKEREKAIYLGGEKIVHRDLEQIHFAIGFDSFSFDDPDFYPLQAFSTFLGGGMSSRLFQEIRERRGLAYSIFTFNSAYVDGGTFGIYVGSGQDQFSELVPVLAEETLRSNCGITEDEANRARAQLKSGLLMSLESSSSRCERLARHMLIFGRPIPINEMVSELDSVSKTDIERVAQRIIGSSEPSIAVLGPISGFKGKDSISQNFRG